MNKNTKKERLEALRKILKETEVSDQSQLLKELEKMGIHTTQATISRDFHTLKTTKVRIRPGVYKYKLLERSDVSDFQKRLEILFENFVFDIKATGNQLLIKTSPGSANSVASIIDQMNRPEILGTIAGDDTILLIALSEEQRKIIEEEYWEILNRVS